MELRLDQTLTVNVAVHYASYKGFANINYTFNDLYLYPTMMCKIYQNINSEVPGMEVYLNFDYYDPDNQIAYYYKNIYTSSPE